VRDSDQQFFDSFMLVIGILIGVAVGLFYLARWTAGETQGQYIREDPEVLAAIEERIEPIGRVLLMGDEELAAAAAAAVPMPDPVQTVMSGPQVYNMACIACHGTGLAGAPPIGDRAAWAPRIEKGLETLNMHALEGFTVDTGFMPAKGGFTTLSDAEVIEAVQYIVEQSQ
jgi:cytochrome c5